MDIPVNMGAALSFHITKIKVFQVQKLAENTFTLIKYVCNFFCFPQIIYFYFSKDIFKTILHIPEVNCLFIFLSRLFLISSSI